MSVIGWKVEKWKVEGLPWGTEGGKPAPSIAKGSVGNMRAERLGMGDVLWEMMEQYLGAITKPPTTMAAFKDFEEIIAWKLAIKLGGTLHRQFNTHRDFTFRDQLCRAATSISNNIAEGFDRGSNKDFIRFLRIARGSCNEVRSMMSLAIEYGYLEPASAETHKAECRRVSATIQALIKSMRKDQLKPLGPIGTLLLLLLPY